MASNTENNLPRPIYPEFPPEFYGLIPADPKPIDERCVCWNCMPKLWDALAGHTTRLSPFVDNDQSIRWAPSLQHSCDIRAVAKFMVEQTSLLWSSTFSPRQKQAIEDVKEFKKKLDRLNKDPKCWKDPPDLQVLGDALSALLYRSSLHDKCTYAWVTHGENDELVSDRLGTLWHARYPKEQKYIIGVTALGHPKHLYITPQKREMNVKSHKHRSWSMMGTMIHELLHLLLYNYCCNGNCQHGTVSQQKLCAYLYARTVGLFQYVLYKGQKRRIWKYGGHGLVFQDLGRRLEYTAIRILDPEDPNSVDIGVRSCRCPRFSKFIQPSECYESSCLSHCCETYEDMQISCKQKLDGNHVAP